MLQSMGSQRVGHDWATELNWSELIWTGKLERLTSVLANFSQDAKSFRRQHAWRLETRLYCPHPPPPLSHKLSSLLFRRVHVIVLKVQFPVGHEHTAITCPSCSYILHTHREIHLSKDIVALCKEWFYLTEFLWAVLYLFHIERS